MRNCPKPDCGIPIAEDDARFCPACRTRLPPASASAAIPDAGDTAPAYNVPVGRPCVAGVTPESEGPVPLREVSTIPPPVDVDGHKTPDIQTNHTGKSRCKDLRVRYNEGRIFLTGSTMPFEFNILPLTEGLTDLTIVIRAGGEEVIYPLPEAEPDTYEEIETNIEFRPPPHFGGYQPFVIFVGYTVDNKREWYTVNRKHWVFSPRERVGNVLEKLNIEIKTEANSCEAGTTSVNNYIQGLENLNKYANSPIEDFKAFNPPPVWVPLVLLKAKPPVHAQTSSKPKPPPAQEAVQKSLTLHLGEHRIHLLAATEVSLGRNKDCGIVVRLPYGGGARPEDPKNDHNLYISKKHASLCVTGGRAFVRDDNSARGTSLDGSLLAKNQSIPLPLDRSVALAVAVDVPASLPRAVFDCRAWSLGHVGSGSSPCPVEGAGTEIAAVTLQRRDTPNEVFVLLAHRIRLADVIPGCRDACLCRHHDAFVLKTPSVCRWLIPGAREPTPDGTVLVEPFKQEGL